MIPIRLMVIDNSLKTIEKQLETILSTAKAAYLDNDHSTFDRQLENNGTVVESALLTHAKTSRMIDRLTVFDNAAHVVAIEKARDAVCPWRDLANEGNRVKAIKELMEYMRELSFGLKESIGVVDLHLEIQKEISNAHEA